MDFETWWRTTGQLDETGKDDWRECWDAATAAEVERCKRLRELSDTEWMISLMTAKGPLKREEE